MNAKIGENVDNTAILAAGRRVLIPLTAVIVSFLVGIVVIVLMGVPIGKAISSFLSGALGSPYAISASLNRTVTLALVGTGFVVAARAGLTNVGGEGQIAIGGMIAVATCFLPGVAALPLGLAFIVPLIGGAIAGGIWGAIAGILKVKAGTNEVISTLLLSFIAIWIVYWSVQSEHLLRQPMTSSATLPESLPIPVTTQVPLLTGSYAAPVTWGLPIMLVLAVVTAVLLSSSVFGFNLKTVGLNPVAAARAGVPVGRSIVLSLFIAGAFGGLAGALMLQGEQYSLKAGFSSNYGFDGLVVGLLARNSIAGVIAGALLFGFMRSGGISMEMMAGVPSAIVGVIQGLIVVIIAGAAYFADRRSAS